MSFTERQPLTGENKLPEWLAAQLDLASLIHGPISVGITTGLAKAFPYTPLVVLFPGRQFATSYDHVTLSYGEKRFSSGRSRVLEVAPDGAVDLCPNARVIPYGGCRPIPLFMEYNGALLINCTFGDTPLSEITRMGGVKPDQPLDPGNLLFSDFISIVDKYKDAAKQAKTDLMADQWAAHRRADLDQLIAKNQTLVDANAKEIAKYQANIRQAIAKIQELNRFIAGAKLELKDKASHLAEYKRICTTILGKLYEDLEFSQGRLLAYTLPITLTDPARPNTTYNIGKYLFDIQLVTGEIRVSSLAPWKVRDCCHPHVNREGIPCLGSISSTLPTLITTGGIAAALELMYNWVSSYAPKDSYFDMMDFKGLPAQAIR